MLTIDNKQFRNLEEQVEYNTSLLNLLPDGIIGDKFRGIRETYEGIQIGECCLVGEEAPYTLWYRELSGRFVNLGEFPKQGPQGPQGLRGPKGDRGVDGTNWEISVEDIPAGRHGELWLKIDTGDVYQSVGNAWVLQGNIRGPQGLPGERGLRGYQGPQGPQGEPGTDGEPGGSYKIEGIADSFRQLPQDPTTDMAYLVNLGTPEDPDYFLYIFLTSYNEWVNVGRFTPQTIDILQTTGEHRDAVMSQKAVTDALAKAGREASAMAMGKPNFVGDLRKFAYMKEYNKVWKEEFGRVYLADAEGDQADYYTAYAVYFGENYNPDASYIFTDDPYPYYIRFAGSDVFERVDPEDLQEQGGALNWKLAYGDNLAEVRFSLSDDGWFSTLPLESFQDFGAYVDVQPLPTYNFNGITDSGDQFNFGNPDVLNFNNADYIMSFRNEDDLELDYVGFTIFDENDDQLLHTRFDIADDDISIVFTPDPNTRTEIHRNTGMSFPMRNSAACIRVHWNGETTEIVYQAGGVATVMTLDSLPNYFGPHYLVLEAPEGTAVQFRVREHPVDNWFASMRPDGVGERINDDGIRVLNLIDYLYFDDSLTPLDIIQNQFNTLYSSISRALHKPKNIILYLNSLNYDEIPKWVYDSFIYTIHSLGIEVTIGIASSVYNDNPDFPDSFSTLPMVESIQADTPAMVAYQLLQLAK